MQQAKGWAGAVLIIVLLAVGMGYLASHDTMPRPQDVGKPPIVPAAPAPLSDARQVLPRIRLLARQTQGDWTRLSPQDRQLLDGYTGGHGRAMFRMMAENSLSPSQAHGNNSDPKRDAVTHSENATPGNFP